MNAAIPRQEVGKMNSQDSIHIKCITWRIIMTAGEHVFLYMVLSSAFSSKMTQRNFLWFL